jgi:hypothetical protein
MGARLPGTAALKVRTHPRALEGITPSHPPAYSPVVGKKAGGERLSTGVAGPRVRAPRISPLPVR